uniref:Replication factor A C-terminal domain-containing protein n=1 Tax=Noctiluca scintillans TaxID=2966 RepID=A0A7S1AXU8_NOCSC|mmetsp:Transcript_64769/g.171414  ORF Transcript_64769/g.171414 Transcript_64769/m.171414 type:complete len:116 (+) Transcript_64769:2-349(+)
MNLRCRFVDAQDGVWLTTFHEAAQQVLGMTADELHVAEREARENGEGGREALESRIKAQYFAKPLQVTVRAKVDMYNGERRSNVTCVSACAVQPAESGRKMLAEIENMLAACACA